MFSCRVPGAFICRQCQSRSLRLSSPVHRPVVIPASRFASTAPTNDFPESSSESNASPVFVRALGNEGSESSAAKKRLRKIGGRRGKQIHETSAALGVETLGTPAEIIILHDAGSTHEEAKEIKDSAENVQELKGPTKEEILASLQREQATPTQQEVNKAIDSLKPTDHTVSLPRQKYQELSSQLYNGFTYGQLYRYVKEVHPDQSRELSRKAFWKVAKDCTEWCPGIRPIEERLTGIKKKKKPRTGQVLSESPLNVETGSHNLGILDPPDRKKRTQKDRIIDRILQSCWGIEVNEVIYSIGQLEIQLPQRVFELFQVGGSRNTLDFIRTLRRCRIDVYWPDRVIRITADKATAEYAADDILKKYRARKKVELDIKLLKSLLNLPADFDAAKNFELLISPEDLAVASKLSRTVIYATGPDTIMIRGFEQTDLDLAQMILLDLVNLSSGRKSHLLADGATYPKAQLQPTAFHNTLRYNARQSALARWVLPVERASIPIQRETKGQGGYEERAGPDTVTRSLESEVSRSYSKLLDLLNKPLSSPFFPKSVAKAKETSASYWPASPQREIHAGFGHVLHNFSGRNDKLHLSHELQKTSRDVREFSSTVPGLAQCLSKLASQREPATQTVNSISLKLIPSPWAGSSLSTVHDYPPITLRWNLDPHTRKPVFREMSAELGSRIVDYILPERVADMRLTKRETIYALPEIFLQKASKLRTFIRSVEETLRSDSLLTSPPRVAISIPEWFVQSNKTIQKLKKEWKDAKEVEVEYAPVHFEHTQMMRAKFGLHTLSYAAVEGGTLGGGRGELKLRMGHPLSLLKTESKSSMLLNQAPKTPPAASGFTEDTVNPADEQASGASAGTDLKEFVQSCFGLADLIHHSAQEELPTVYLPSTPKTEVISHRTPFEWEWDNEKPREAALDNLRTNIWVDSTHEIASGIQTGLPAEVLDGQEVLSTEPPQDAEPADELQDAANGNVLVSDELASGKPKGFGMDKIA